MRILLSFALALLPMLGLAQGPILRNPVTTNAFMNSPQNGWIAIWNNVAGRWSNGVNTASATNDSQPPSTVLSNLTQTGVSPGATNASAYIGSSSGLGTNTSIYRFLKTYGDFFVSSNLWSTGNITGFGVAGIEAIGGGFQVSGGSGYRSSGWAGDRALGTGLGPNPTVEEQTLTTAELQQLVGVTGGVQTNINNRIANNRGHGTNTTFLNITNIGAMTNVGNFGLGGDGLVFGNFGIGGNLLVGGIASLNALDVTGSLSSTSTNLIDSQAEDVTPANGDYVLVHDVSTASLTKVQLGNLPGGGGGGGGTTNAFTGRILWVDQTNGNDALAIATGGRDFMHPWATISNALRYATNFDQVRVGPGVWFVIGTNWTVPTGVSLIGSGPGVSFITNTINLTDSGPGIQLRSSNLVSGFTMDSWPNTNIQAQIGVSQLAVPTAQSITNSRISGNHIFGDTDGIYAIQTAGAVGSLTIDNNRISTKWDTIVLSGAASTWNIAYNDCRSVGPSAVVGAGGNTKGIWIITGRAYIDYTSSTATNNTVFNVGLFVDDNAYAAVRNSYFDGSGTGGTNFFVGAGAQLDLQTEIGYATNKARVVGAVTVGRQDIRINSAHFSGGQASNSFLYLNAGTNVAAGTFGSGLSFSGGTLTSSGGAGSTNNVAQGIGTSDTTNAVKRHWVYMNANTNVVVDWTKTNYYIVSPSNTFTVSWANAPSAGGLAQSVRLTVINTNSTSGFFPTNGLNGTPVIMLSAPSTNTYLFNFDGTNFWTDSGQILTTGSGDTNVFNVNPTIHGLTVVGTLTVNGVPIPTSPFTNYTSIVGSPTTNILVDASLGNQFRVLLTNTMGLKITNGYDGQRLEVWAYQDGVGNRGLTLVPNTGGAHTNNFEVGEDATGPVVLTTNQFKKDLMLFIYESQSLSTNTSRSNWVYHGVLRKYPN